MTNLICEILIIGAGLAGLAAGYELSLQGYDIKIIEATNRIGGRVSTCHFSDGIHFEEGPFSFGNGEQPLWRYIQQFNLPVIEHTPMQRKFCFKDYVGTTDQKAFFLQAEEKEVILYELFDHFRPKLQKITEDMPFDEALKLIGASANAIEWLQTMTLFGLLGNGFQQLSTKFALSFMKQYDNSTSFYALQGGNDQLPQAFAKPMKKDIFFDCRVNKVEQLHDTCLVTGSTCTIETKRVIFAIPLSELSKIDISPALSIQKQQAIAEVFYTPCARLSIVGLPNILSNIPQAGVFLFSDQLGWVRDQSAFQYNVGKKTVINASVTADKAYSLASCNQQWKKDLNDLLYRTYDHWSADGAQYCVSFLKEGYSSFSVNAYQQREYLSQPEGNFYFAGEHTDESCASMNAAIKSGIRAAQEVLSSLPKAR